MRPRVFGHMPAELNSGRALRRRAFGLRFDFNGDGMLNAAETQRLVKGSLASRCHLTPVRGGRFPNA